MEEFCRFEQRERSYIQELVISSLAQSDALAKLLIEKGVITEHEFLLRLLWRHVTRTTQLRCVKLPSFRACAGGRLGPTEGILLADMNA